MDDENRLKNHFSRSVMRELFPGDRSNRFFEALFGDTDEGAYDIELSFQGCRPDHLEFCFNLKRRPGKCLACNLTYGLPQVFALHPVIDVKGVVTKIGSVLGDETLISQWRLGHTHEVSPDLHTIPFLIYLQTTDL